MNTIPAILKPLHDTGSLRALDCYFADVIGRAAGSDAKELLLAAALTSRLLADNHVCLDLDEYGGTTFPDDNIPDTGAPPHHEKLPDAKSWKETLRAADAVIGKTGDLKPLILEGNRLYLHRYHAYENRVADIIRERVAQPPIEVSKETGAFIAQLLNSPVEQGGDRQRLAAFLALRHRLTVITGGPGTGKTYTVARIIALAIQQHQLTRPDTPFQVKIAAPTGKAAIRLCESIREAGDGMTAMPKAVLDQIPTEAFTIHRLLGSIPNQPFFRHHRHHPLDADLIIVDESSMIDLALMAKLLDALRPDARLILLGDMDQLASVEPGSVFGDICRAASPDRFAKTIAEAYRQYVGTKLTDTRLEWSKEDGPLDNVLVRLYPSRRFPSDSPIGSLAEAINTAPANDPAAAARVWSAAEKKFASFNPLTSAAEHQPEIQWHDAPDRLVDGAGRPLKDFRQFILAGYKRFLDANSVEEAFEALTQFRVFCALRRGPYGVETVNRLIERILSLDQITDLPEAYRPLAPLKPVGEFYHKRVVMVTRNDYSLNLFNGDIGIVWNTELTGSGDDSSRQRQVWFETGDAAGKRIYRELAVNLLPDHETALAMTVHKAQGSQFRKIAVLLPPRDNERLFTRELLYTAITRPTNEAVIWCSRAIFERSVQRKTARHSGLQDKLAADAFQSHPVSLRLHRVARVSGKRLQTDR